MAKSKYTDTTAIIQVIGCVFNNPKLLDFTDKYFVQEDDFQEQFHKIIYGTIFKLHELGSEEISIENINDFLSTRPKSQAVFNQEKGNEWILKASQGAIEASFDYYYSRLKKMTLLRMYESYGIDVREIYDPDNILDLKKKEKQEENLDNLSLLQIADLVDQKIEAIKMKYVEDSTEDAYQAGDGIIELINKFKEYPEVGVPMYGPLINTITRGARLKKFYLRSAPTGVGKTRSMIADACNFACKWIYDDNFGWIRNGTAEPTLFITTEQEIGEIQTMMLAFLANVEEGHILDGKYEDGEEERIMRAAEVIKESPLYIEELPDFSLMDIENKIKKNIREHGVKYVVHDYIHTSLKILEEISRRSGGVKLREDNILFMLSTRLKDIANKCEVFIISATQLSGDYADAETPDQNLLRGAKSIAD